MADDELTRIDIRSEGYRLTGWISGGGMGPRPGVLFVHGGGRYTENPYVSWHAYLTARGYAACSFFHRGVGGSEGSFELSTLRDRHTDAVAAWHAFTQSGLVDPARLCLYGSSMGGHVAVSLLSVYPSCRAIILQSAAAYDAAAETVPFTDSFTRVISSPESWAASPSFTALSSYTGRSLIVYGEADTVIPDGVKQSYRAAARHGEYESIPGGTHTLLRPATPGQAAARDVLYARCTSFLDAVL